MILGPKTDDTWVLGRVSLVLALTYDKKTLLKVISRVAIKGDNELG